MEQFSDTIVIGAGVGGLATAALLQHRLPNERVLVLEAHTVSGGCASSYDRSIRLPGSENEKSRFRLDVGATTLSGLGEGRPVERLLNELGVQLDAVQVDPGIVITLRDGRIVRRFADTERWYEESKRVFGEQTILFWQEIDRIASRAWSVSSRYPRFPFTSVSDVLSSSLKVRLSDLGLLHLARTPLYSLLIKHGLGGHEDFKRFVDQLLMISVQCTSNEASTLVAALGLEYPAHTYYVHGGLYSLTETLERSIVDNGGAVKFKAAVVGIDHDRTTNSYTVYDSKERVYRCKRLISNATIWDSLKLFHEPPERLVRKIRTITDRTGQGLWGALMLTGIISDDIDDGGSLYHQYHTDNGSLFLSLSHPDDRSRAPKGWRTLSVSSHEQNAERWLAMDENMYRSEQQRMLEAFDAVLQLRLAGYSSCTKLLLELGTPRTFAFYTHRKNGWVGGIPHTIKNWMPRWQSNMTPMDGFYLVGDTVFPGQGTPAVVQSAINLCNRLASD